MMNGPVPPSMSSNGVVQGWHLITTPHTKREKVQTQDSPTTPPNMTGLTSSALVFQKLWRFVLAGLLGWGKKERGAWHYITVL